MAINKIDLGQVVPDIDMTQYATKDELAKKVGMTDKVLHCGVTASTQDWPGINIRTNSYRYSLFMTPESLVNWNSLEDSSQWTLPCNLLSKFKFGHFEYTFSVATAWNNVYMNYLQWNISSLGLKDDEYAIFVTITSTKTGAVYTHTIYEKNKTQVKLRVTCPFSSKDDLIQVYYLIIAYK